MSIDWSPLMDDGISKSLMKCAGENDLFQVFSENFETLSSINSRKEYAHITKVEFIDPRDYRINLRHYVGPIIIIGCKRHESIIGPTNGTMPFDFLIVYGFKVIEHGPINISIDGITNYIATFIVDKNTIPIIQSHYRLLL